MQVLLREKQGLEEIRYVGGGIVTDKQTQTTRHCCSSEALSSSRFNVSPDTSSDYPVVYEPLDFREAPQLLDETFGFLDNLTTGSGEMFQDCVSEMVQCNTEQTVCDGTYPAVRPNTTPSPGLLHAVTQSTLSTLQLFSALSLIC